MNLKTLSMSDNGKILSLSGWELFILRMEIYIMEYLRICYLIRWEENITKTERFMKENFIWGKNKEKADIYHKDQI